MTKAPVNFDHGDDLSDLLGGGTAAPRELDPAFARIRDLADAPPAGKLFKVPCTKCNGRGRFIAYTGRDLGPCFKCEGRGSFERKTSPEKLATNRVKAAERKVRSEQENWDAFFQAHPKHADVLVNGAKSRNENWNRICTEIMGKVRKYGDLHAGTMAMLDRAVEREAQFAAKRVQEAAQRQEQVASVDVANIVDCFQRAQEAGLKRFTLRFADAHFQVDKNDPALIWVSRAGYGSEKYGRITGGAFRPGRDANAEVIARIAEISKDPMKAALAYAQVTSSCSVCGKHLENQDSVDAGIGPVCAGRINRPGLKFERVEDFQ
jgi:hypothetical protein